MERIAQVENMQQEYNELNRLEILNLQNRVKKSS